MPYYGKPSKTSSCRSVRRDTWYELKDVKGKETDGVGRTAHVRQRNPHDSIYILERGCAYGGDWEIIQSDTKPGSEDTTMGRPTHVRLHLNAAFKASSHYTDGKIYKISRWSRDTKGGSHDREFHIKDDNGHEQLIFEKNCAVTTRVEFSDEYGEFDGSSCERRDGGKPRTPEWIRFTKVRGHGYLKEGFPYQVRPEDLDGETPEDNGDEGIIGYITDSDGDDFALETGRADVQWEAIELTMRPVGSSCSSERLTVSEKDISEVVGMRRAADIANSKGAGEVAREIERKADLIEQGKL